MVLDTRLCLAKTHSAYSSFEPQLIIKCLNIIIIIITSISLVRLYSMIGVTGWLFSYSCVSKSLRSLAQCIHC
jgi:hypothetical protein